MTRLASALALAAKGFPVFPIKPGAKHPPLLNGWPTKATTDPATVEMYWLPMPDANIGVHCKDLIVLDVDPKKGGDDALAALDLVYGLPDTLVARTPSGGRHLYFRGGPVANGVDVLGRGIDIRSTGGYVVAPGSETAAGSYTWEDEARSITEAPEWLVLKLGTIVPKLSTTAPERVADAPGEVVAHAAGWLKHQAPAVEGAGGDAHTYKVICGLRDRGVSSVQARVLIEEWNDRCAPPWSAGELDAKVANAYRYASGEPGSKAALPEDFPIVEVSTPVLKTAHALMSLSEFANREQKSAGYVIKGLLMRASYAETFGAPGEGKTFVALDQAYHVAAGKPWMDRKVHAGPVLYLAYEGVGGMVKRAKALRQKYGAADAPLFIVGAAFNLREKVGRAELGQVIAALPAKPVLIVVDTFARALMGGDENSAQDVGAFNSAIAALIESTGACVMIVHHSGKDKSKGARGSSALLGAIDTEIEVDGGQVVARKQRDIELAEGIGFKLHPMVVGIDEDGDEVTSCVVEPAAVGPAGPGRLTGNAKRGWEALCALRPNNKPVAALEWRDACREFLGDKGLAQRFYDIKKALKDRGFIAVDDNDMVTRRME